MKFTQAMLFGLALIVGVGVGYMFNPSVEVPAPERREMPKGSIGAEDEALVKTLRARIESLEAKLAERSEVRTEEKAAAVDGEKSNRGMHHGPFGGMSPKEWREKMKKENPERYIQMTNGMARWRQERLERAQKKVGFLSSIDVSKMSASARKTHDELQDLIAKREQMEQKMQKLGEAADDLTPEARHEIFREMFETDKQIRELNALERANLIQEVGLNIGLGKDDAASLCETVQQIIENTEGGFNSTGRPPMGGPGGNPPPMPR